MSSHFGDDGTDQDQKDVVRREPVRMALAAPTANDPEMGEREL